MEYGSNYKAFNGDRRLGNEIEKLAKGFSVKTIVETGTFLGNSAKEMSKWAEKVHSIDNNKLFLKIAKNKCRTLSNVVYSTCKVE